MLESEIVEIIVCGSYRILFIGFLFFVVFGDII